ncbi:hypothetical protein KKH07_02950, partial [Patescibacteria group bacterium]|nr:hypothetical protein [Patescibacteria group bacterium]MBU1563967.1 hypothetical protein [Patescibacteria group bacterium]
MKIDILKKIQKESYLERGRQAIKFVEDHLDPDSVDEPWLRSSYILMSFGFEIILKSRVIALSHASNKLELDQELIKIGHNFISLFEVLGEKELKHIGLKKDIIKEPYNNYNYFVIETINDKSIKIENFNDIRYGG